MREELTQRCCTASLWAGSVVRMKSVFEALAALANAYHPKKPPEGADVSLYINACRVSLFEQHPHIILTLNRSLISSHRSPGSRPNPLATCWIFNPCSSVPVANLTSRSGSRTRAYRARTSVRRREWRWPTWGAMMLEQADEFDPAFPDRWDYREIINLPALT